MDFCCEDIKDANSKSIIDYTPNFMVTIDSNGRAYPIDMCPWCGTEFENPSIDRIDRAVDELSCNRDD